MGEQAYCALVILHDCVAIEMISIYAFPSL